MPVHVIDNLNTVAPAQWDALVPGNQPFL
ncbi:hypothetical protein A249_27180, partial [Pseudomonas syringae pv. actinidiae ICMP 18804]